jgi:small subunit ribosomal protein S3
MRDYLRKKLLEAFVSNVEVERTAKQVNVIIHSARPGVIIGKGGVGIEELRKHLSRAFIKDKNMRVNVSIKEVGKPNMNATLVAQAIKFDIEKRIPFRRAMKQAIMKVEKSGGLGVKVILSGRLNGAEIARTEMLVSGKLPLHTLRADISYAEEPAYTTYGVIGIKVWIYRGNVFATDIKNEETPSLAPKDSFRSQRPVRERKQA